ncbi:hypothetical protein L249_4416 [Ophiocordyceps polyrhachis-furcata BCC 54312]|uniref:Mid2 domain-containing protein n=1 Tax=Ophiocordyceps polyrhachis-furcata BCC 54312 TaxID=1330021 RepID=A0A367L7M7_9HYPO|nr:hypothetical protein L249_4416 [Ophiocordyceps polyrhachis-furcata BCC 54312]
MPLDRRPWSLLAMAALTSAQALRTTTMMDRRDAVAPGTVCGYIGGEASLPATCTAGSHCALDVAHGVVGCCPDDGPCSTGVFTSCVDANSGPQTVSDAYVYTCRGGKVCYRNVFDGGFYQFGCGLGSGLATSVATTAPSGVAALAMARVTLAMTESRTILATPVDVGASFTPAPTSSSSSSSSGEGEGDKGVDGDGGPPSSTSGPDASAPPPDPASPPTGAIVGGTVGGVAAVAALIALLVFAFRRRRRRPIKKALMGSSNADNNRNHDVDDDDDDDDDDDFRSVPYSPKLETRKKATTAITTTNTTATTATSTATATDSNTKAPSSPSPPPKTMPRFANVAMYPDRVPLATSAMAFDDPRPAPRPGSVIVEDPGEDEVEDEANDDNDAAASAYPGPRRNGSGALWQQNRRQRRNLMWI